MMGNLLTFARTLYYNNGGYLYPVITNFQAKSWRKEDTCMKKYMAPEVETLTFAAEEAIAGLSGSNLFNDGEFGSW